jgi:hypothetical protein
MENTASKAHKFVLPYREAEKSMRVARIVTMFKDTAHRFWNLGMKAQLMSNFLGYGD